MPISTSRNEHVRSQVVPMTPLNLYLKRIGSVTEGIRAQTAGYSYMPFQLGGLLGQQQALVAQVAVNIIDFKVSGDQ